MLILAVIYLLAGACSKGNNAQAGRSSGGRTLVPVEAVVVKPQLLRNTITTTGTLLANEEVELRSEISGRVTGIYFEEGKRVRKGELLLKINDRELKAQLARKEVEEKQASDEEKRKQRLIEIKVISQEEYDNVHNSLKMVQAEKEAIQAQLAKTEIIAPFDGIIGLRSISQGGYVSPNDIISTIQEIDPMKAEFSVPEKYAGLIKNGTIIVLKAGDTQEEYKGTVYAVESKIDQETRTIKARARIPNPGGKLIPGAFARIEITLQEIPDAIVVPSEAIVPEIDGEKVYVCRGGKAESIPIESGIRTERAVEITRGLGTGDTLIVSGLLQLANGRGVEIKAIKDN